MLPTALRSARTDKNPHNQSFIITYSLDCNNVKPAAPSTVAVLALCDGGRPSPPHNLKHMVSSYYFNCFQWLQISLDLWVQSGEGMVTLKQPGRQQLRLPQLWRVRLYFKNYINVHKWLISVSGNQFCKVIRTKTHSLWTFRCIFLAFNVKKEN